jgi:hypothetical protein
MIIGLRLRRYLLQRYPGRGRGGSNDYQKLSNELKAQGVTKLSRLTTLLDSTKQQFRDEENARVRNAEGSRFLDPGVVRVSSRYASQDNVEE